MTKNNEKKRSLRWWPALLIIAVTAGYLISLWSRQVPYRQVQTQGTLIAIATALLLLLLWLLLFSRLRWHTRLRAFLVICAIAVLAMTMVRFRGVSGDVVPVFEWRWAGSQTAAPAPIAQAEKDVVPAPEIAQQPEAGTDAGPAAKASHSPRPADSTAAVSPASPPVTLKTRAQPNSPGFLGANRAAMVPGLHMQTDWQRYPPMQRWRRPVGDGWSSFAVAQGRAITHEQHGNEERVVAYDLASGSEVWSHRDATRYENPVSGIGPRATPTIAGDRVFTLGATGILNCLDFATGTRLWSKNIVEENGGHANEWGISCSPLVVDSLVIVAVDRTEDAALVAYGVKTGERVWHRGGDRAGYSSPQLNTLAGTNQIVIFNQRNIVAHEPATGRILWQHGWREVSQAVAQPVLLPDNRLFVSSGYGAGSLLLHITRGDDGTLAAERIWRSPRMKAKFANVVYHDGHIYGFDDGVLACIELQQGERMWKKGRYGHGQLLLVGDVLLVQGEFGDLILVAARPDELVELARMPALAGKSWNVPVIAGNLLLLRNDREAVCYELALAEPMAGD